MRGSEFTKEAVGVPHGFPYVKKVYLKAGQRKLWDAESGYVNFIIRIITR